VAGGRGAQLLVVSDQQQLRGGLGERGQHVRLEHLGRLLEDDDAAAELAHDALELGRASRRHPNHSRSLRYTGGVLTLVKVSHAGVYMLI